MKAIILFFCILFSGFSLYAQPGSYISVKQHTEVLENGKKISNDVDLFFDNNKHTITKYYHASTEFVMVSNALGEIKTYYPATNEVGYKQMSELSSKRNLIYYFANNLTDHLGLAEEGFNLVSNTYENQFYVTLWKAPSILKGIETVKMVFDNGLPVYSEYQANKKKILKKIYYTNYKDFSQFRLPLKIIEISYLPTGDSIINRTLFSNVKVSSLADNKYFNFKIPDNAKPFGANKSK
ncbi:MAG: hypothetical protein A2066_15100 [Bacteroidetes bacterium GWB2_41_8]|nr:MAG: hypothetical protein A2066_15100 [Bacteroidetes bacterium GWB2_41_8]